MRAARIVPAPEGGRVAVLDIDTPRPGPDQVIVKVVASSLNRGEILAVPRALDGPDLPIGVEFAGTIAEVGADVTEWSVGDRVMGHGNGGQAEYVAASRHTVMAVPEGVSWPAAASFVNVYMTAHDALVTNGRLAPGENVLVNAASSGIGLAAIQIARAMGAGTIIATTRSADKEARLAEAGADVVINTSVRGQTEAVMEATDGRGVDVIIDSIGGTVFDENLDSLAVKGRLIQIGRLGSGVAQIDLNKLWLKRLHLIGVTFRTRSEEERIGCFQAMARDLLEPLGRHEIQPLVDSTFPLEEIGDAHAYMGTDQHVGKIVIVVDPAAVGSASPANPGA